MSPEQKQAASDRLAAAREKRLRENPPQYKNISDTVLALDPEEPWSLSSVKEYIKHQKDLLKRHRQSIRRGEKGAEAKYLSTKAYINNMETYLRTGIWLDLYWGKDRENRVKDVCYAKAYYHEGPKKGLVKRTVGVYYPDLGATYERHMGDV